MSIINADKLALYFVGLVPYLADKLLKHVLHCEYTHCAAVLVKHNHHMRF